MRALSCLVLIIAAALVGCAVPCRETSDCAAGQVCLDGADGRVCTVVAEGEGEGERCGDGVVDVGEGCDDGNDNGGDGCTSACAPTSVRTSPILGSFTSDTLPLQVPVGVDANRDGALVIDRSGLTWLRPATSSRWVAVGATGSRDERRSTQASARIFASPDSLFLVGPDSSLVLFDIATGDAVPYAGSDELEGLHDAPTGVFLGPFDPKLSDVRALAVDENEVLHIGSQHQVITIDGEGVTRQLAGSVDTSAVPINEARALRFEAIPDMAFELTADDEHAALWLLMEDASGQRSVARVTPEGDVDLVVGGDACAEGVDPTTCSLVVDSIVDGVGGVWLLGSGALHFVDAVTRTATVVATGLDASLPASFVEPDVLLVPSRAGSARLVDVQSGDVTDLPPMRRSSRGRDRSFSGRLRTMAASAARLYFSVGHDVYALTVDGDLDHVANVNELPGCAPDFDTEGDVQSLAVTETDDVLYISHINADGFCEVDLATGASAPAPIGFSAQSMAVRGGELIVRLGIGGVQALDRETGESTPVAIGERNAIDVDVFDGTAYLLFDDGTAAALDADGVVPPSFFTLSADALRFAVTSASSAMFVEQLVPQLFEAKNGEDVEVVVGTTEGFRDGDVASALVELGIRDVARFAGGVVFMSDTSIRLLKDGVVTTLVGSDQFTTEGAFAAARLDAPRSLSCVGERCLVADEATATLRMLDFGTDRLERVHGADGQRLEGLASAALLDDGRFVYANGSVIRAVTDGVDLVLAQGAAVGTPTLLADAGDGDVVFFSRDGADGAGRVAVAGTQPRALVDVAATALAVDRATRTLYVGTNDGVSSLDLDDDDAALERVHDGPGVVALALDAFGNLVIATRDQLVARARGGDGALATEARVLAAAGDELWPFAGGDEGCIGGIAAQGDGLVVVDRCVGTAWRVALE